MNNLKELPIFCDRCPTLAFAIVDGSPLCEACLFKTVTAIGADVVTAKIEPLQFAQPKDAHFHSSQSFS